MLITMAQQFSDFIELANRSMASAAAVPTTDDGPTDGGADTPDAMGGAEGEHSPVPHHTTETTNSESPIHED